MKNLLSFVLFALFPAVVSAQGFYLRQYFDGEDTVYGPYNAQTAILVELDTPVGNVWQVGSPQKTLFNDEATFPNAIVTDTLQTYPVNNQSSFVVSGIISMEMGVLAIQWKQKLDYEH